MTQRWGRDVRTGLGWAAAACLLGTMAVAPAAVAGGTVVTAGGQQITFSATPASGAIGSVDGYVEDTFNLETGQGGNVVGGADLTLWSDAQGQPTLAGDLAAVPASDGLASAPTSNTVPATPGEVLLVLDQAGNYALVTVVSATAQTVRFNYALASSVTAAPQPQTGQQGATGGQAASGGQAPSGSASQGSGAAPQASGTSPSSGTQQSSGTSRPSGASPSSGTPGQPAASGGAICAQDNQAVATLGGGSTASLDVAFSVVTQGVPFLDVTITTPTDVTAVKAWQGGTIGGLPWTTNLDLVSQTGHTYVFGMGQTDYSQIYHVDITSPTLTAAGYSPAAVEWTYAQGGATQSVPGCAPQPTGTSTGTGGTAGPAGTAASGASAPTGAGASTAAGAKVVVLRLGQTSATVNGQPVTLDVPAQVSLGSTMVPFRFLGQALGASVGWNNAQRTAIYQLGSTRVLVVLGASSATVDGQAVPLPVPAESVSGRTLVPLRFVSQALGAQVSFDAATRTITVTLQAAG